MYVLFRLDSIAGVLPVVDAHASESALRVEVGFAGQIQATDDFCVPSRSERVEVEARTQLLWTAPAEPASAGALDVALYQDWPGAREAHPARICLGRCAIKLPAEQCAAEGHAALAVAVALDLSTHPLPSATHWPAAVVHGVVECAALATRPRAGLTAHVPPTPEAVAPDAERAARSAARIEALRPAPAPAPVAPAAERVGDQRRPQARAARRARPAAAAAVNMAAPPLDVHDTPTPGARAARTAAAAAAAAARVTCAAPFESALAAAKAAAARDLARTALGEWALPDSCGQHTALMPPHIAHLAPTHGACSNAASSLVGSAAGTAGAAGASRARGVHAHVAPASSFAFGESVAVPMCSPGGPALGPAAVRGPPPSSAPTSVDARISAADVTGERTVRAPAASCAPQPFAFGEQSTIGSDHAAAPSAARARVEQRAVSSLSELSDALLLEIASDPRALPSRQPGVHARALAGASAATVAKGASPRAASVMRHPLQPALSPNRAPPGAVPHAATAQPAHRPASARSTPARAGAANVRFRQANGLNHARPQTPTGRAQRSTLQPAARAQPRVREIPSDSPTAGVLRGRFDALEQRIALALKSCEAELTLST
ncbi:hypothetical protein KFE25_005537 [Diacronema lutheri]|uniref:Uncharacterized protein n=1 Tax=Diacronema lutheri TaxID=2081491 RepID=A0A8J6C903_DIALT|nr:hypothetical protein KFE25_005537 [Diacronema lutheri]